ncbi:hypothetical protein NDU88_004947 [Pleurodeles waltl]|uniref:Lamina-associated polypeptide 2 alpha C-terminal domain-containing protein n=1 Tax=Pleurodeles waltl TaxID=8319 RepID=A0AAV7PEI7_PLEWA|nr:hypothetical protein NDU88_004947 [Pleurodeles waltl]
MQGAPSEMLKDLPDSIPIDSFVARLVGHTFLAEDAIIRDSVDKKVDVARKKLYLGAHLALQAGIYGTYVVQSLIPDMKSLYRALDESSDCPGVLEHIEHQVEFLSDVSFDGVRTSVLLVGACVGTWCSLVLQDWMTDLAQRSSALRTPFQESVLFGSELEEELHRLFKAKKHSSSLRSLLGDYQPSKCKSPLQVFQAAVCSLPGAGFCWTGP